MALVLALSVGVDANHPAKGSQAAHQDLATDMPEEAPTGFNNTTNGFEDHDAFDNDDIRTHARHVFDCRHRLAGPNVESL